LLAQVLDSIDGAGCSHAILELELLGGSTGRHILVVDVTERREGWNILDTWLLLKTFLLNDRLLPGAILRQTLAGGRVWERQLRRKLGLGVVLAGRSLHRRCSLSRRSRFGLGIPWETSYIELRELLLPSLSTSVSDEVS